RAEVAALREDLQRLGREAGWIVLAVAHEVLALPVLLAAEQVPLARREPIAHLLVRDDEAELLGLLRQELADDELVEHRLAEEGAARSLAVGAAVREDEDRPSPGRLGDRTLAHRGRGRVRRAAARLRAPEPPPGGHTLGPEGQDERQDEE